MDAFTRYMSTLTRDVAPDALLHLTTRRFLDALVRSSCLKGGRELQRASPRPRAMSGNARHVDEELSRSHRK
jgi:hypothetical protein